MVLTASSSQDFDVFRHEVNLAAPYYFADGTVLKTMMRANPGLMLLQNGQVIGKWHHNICLRPGNPAAIIMKIIGFLLSRFGHGVLILLGVAVAIFFLFNVLPGDPVALLAGQRNDLATREAITAELGLDKPLPEQLLYYLNDISPVSVHAATAANQEKYEYTLFTSIWRKRAGLENTLPAALFPEQ